MDWDDEARRKASAVREGFRVSEGLRTYSGLKGDERVARRRIALMDATLELLGGQPPQSVTVRGVCGAASLNPRYVYESFESVEALVSATYDRVIEEISRDALAAFATGDDGGAKVRAAVTAIVSIIDSDRRKGRLLFSPMLTSPVLAEKRRDSTAVFAAMTLDTTSAALHTAPGPRAIGAAQFQVGGLGRLLAAWLDDEVPLGRDEVVDLSVSLMISLAPAVTRRV